MPITVKFKGFAVVAERPETVSVLDPPVEMDEGLKAHVAPDPQAKAMDPRNVLGPEAATVKVVVVDPMTMMLDRWLEESEKIGLPVPDTETDVVALTAFEATWTLPD